MESQSLEMANACVSHELRNPLACIVSCSIQKEFDYKYLEDLVKDEADTKSGEEMRDLVLPVIAKLHECNNIQRSSESLMTFQI